jgi:hypothetical protein
VSFVTGDGSSPELDLLLRSIATVRVVALDAEWKPCHRGSPATMSDGTTLVSEESPAPPKFPMVTLLQVAYRFGDGGDGEC